MNDNVRYIKQYYILKGKTKFGQGSMTFYDLEDNDMSLLCLYENEKVRYNNKWYVVKEEKALFYSEKERDEFPDCWIKDPYKKKVPLILSSKNQ